MSMKSIDWLEGICYSLHCRPTTADQGEKLSPYDDTLVYCMSALLVAAEVADR